MSVLLRQRVVLSACCALLFAACSGGSSGTTSTTGTTDTGSGTTVTTASLQSVNNLPDFNIESLDAAATANVSPQLRFVEEGDEEQEYSRAGCELRSHVDEFKFQVKELRSNVCIVKKMESEAGMTVGVGEYAYYNMDFEPGEGPGEDIPGDFDCDTDCSSLSGEDQTQCEEIQASLCFGFSARVRVGVIDDTLHMALCTNESTGSEFVQTMAMRFGVTDGHFDGIVKNVMPSNSGNEEPDAAFSIEAMLATDDPEKFSDGDEAAFLAQMASNMWGSGHIGLDITKVEGAIRNTVDAAFQSGHADSEWGTWTSQAFGIYDSGEGCGTFASEGSFPALAASDAFDEQTLQVLFEEEGIEGSDQICWTHPEEGDCEDGCSIGAFVEEAVDGMCSFDEGGTECFSYELDNGTLGYFVLDPDSAAYYETVVEHEGLDEYVAPTIAFEGDEIWDCEDEADIEFVEIDPSAEAVMAAFESCFDIASDDTRSIESCYEQETQHDAEGEAGVEIHDEDQTFGGDEGEGEDEGDEDDPQVTCDTDCSQAGENQAECEDIQINTLGCD